MKKRLKMKITTARQTTIRGPEAAIRARCSACQREVEMIAIAQAIAILKVGELEFDDLLAGGIVHSIQTVSGSLWVCKDSLFESIDYF